MPGRDYILADVWVFSVLQGSKAAPVCPNRTQPSSHISSVAFFIFFPPLSVKMSHYIELRAVVSRAHSL